MFMVPNAVSLDQMIWADVLAWQLLAFITNPSLIPSKAEMITWLQDKVEEQMNIPLMRSEMDDNYAEFLHYHSTEMEEDLKGMLSDRDISDFHFRALAEIMREVDYPLDIGSFEQLNDIGETMVDFDTHDRNRCPPSSHQLTTFRDVNDFDLSFLYSIHTGSKSIPFKKHWMDLDDFADVSTLCGTGEEKPNGSHSISFKDGMRTMSRCDRSTRECMPITTGSASTKPNNGIIFNSS